MKKYVSISQFPGRQGQYFYTEFFKVNGIAAEYVPLAATIDTFQETLEQSRNCSGISVSMPFKQKVIKYLDHQDSSVSEYDSCNTIVVADGKFFGYNTDLAGVEDVCKHINHDDKILVLGNGCIGKMFLKYLTINKYQKVIAISRSLGNWNERHQPCNVIINCTAIGTVDSSSPLEQLSNQTALVVDLAIKPGQLAQQANQITYISGQKFYQYQFMKQYKLYTGFEVAPSQYKLIAGARS
jgi:shikimate 5-dehydrogenase